MVFLYHIQVFAPIPGPLFTFLRQGYLGVTFFFVLSGFVLTWSWSPAVRQSTFYLRRFARIFPSHAVAWLLAVPVFYAVLPFLTPPGWVKEADWFILLLSFLLLQGWSTAPVILFAGNPAAWTLTVEGFFYALHPFAQRVAHLMTTRTALVVAAGAVMVAWAYRASAWLFDGTWWANLPAPIQHLPEFLLGMCLAWAFRQGWRPRLPVLAGISALAVVVATLAVVPAVQPETVIGQFVARFGNEMFTIACAATIVAAASSTLRGGSGLFSDRVHVRLGEWSYAFYLVHATVMYAAMWVWSPLEPSWRNILPAGMIFLVALIISALVHHGVERPAERWLRRWKDGRDRRALSAAVVGG